MFQIFTAVLRKHKKNTKTGQNVSVVSTLDGPGPGSGPVLVRALNTSASRLQLLPPPALVLTFDISHDALSLTVSLC